MEENKNQNKGKFDPKAVVEDLKITTAALQKETQNLNSGISGMDAKLKEAGTLIDHSLDLIDFFSNYFLKPDEYKVVNIVKHKGVLKDETIKNLEAKYLYPYSKFKNIQAKESIDNFLKTFNPYVQLDNKLYSEYFYMVLSNKNTQQTDTFYSEKPIYILANEMTFSSASIFVSVFKGIGNIKIAGIPTDGSSGMPTTYNLNQSQIEFTISQMISFQKNGNLFDGIGTNPDIELPRTISQILCNEDYQVQQLLKLAKKK